MVLVSQTISVAFYNKGLVIFYGSPRKKVETLLNMPKLTQRLFEGTLLALFMAVIADISRVYFFERHPMIFMLMIIFI